MVAEVAGAAAPEVATDLAAGISWCLHEVHRAQIVDGPFLLDLTIADNGDGTCNLALYELAGERPLSSQLLLRVPDSIEAVKGRALLLARRWLDDEIEIIADRLGLELLFTNPPPAAVRP